jgi:hypothetical protein
LRAIKRALASHDVLAQSRPIPVARFRIDHDQAISSTP